MLHKVDTTDNAVLFQLIQAVLKVKIITTVRKAIRDIAFELRYHPSLRDGSDILSFVKPEDRFDLLIGIIRRIHNHAERNGERVEIKKDGTNWSVLTRIGYSDREPNSTLYKECKEYFTFVAFSELPEADYNSIRRQIEARKNIDEVWAADQERGSKMAQEFRDRSSKDEAESDSSYPMASVEFSDEAERIEEGLCDKLRKFYTRDIQAPIAN